MYITNIIMISFLSFLSLYYFVNYLLRLKINSEKYNLYFSLLGIFLILYISLKVFFGSWNDELKYYNFIVYSIIFVITYFGAQLISTLLGLSKRIKIFFYISYILILIVVIENLIRAIFLPIGKVKLYIYFFLDVGLVSISHLILIVCSFIGFIKKRDKNLVNTFEWIGFLTLIIGGNLEGIVPAFHNNFIFFVILPMLLTGVSILIKFNSEFKELIYLKNSLEEEVDSQTKQLKNAVREKIDFFINYTHETKTPLTIIKNNLAIDMEKRGRSPEMEHVMYNVDKLIKNTNNQLDFEKLDRNQVFYDHDQIINLSELLNEKIHMFKNVVKEKKININSNIQDDIYVKIDPLAIDRVLNNLLDNAIKYNKNNGSIEISLNSSNKKAILKIKDTGIGISEVQLSNIFKPYYQLSHKKRNTQGIGMGLSIVKKILDDVNGEINVKSDPKESSTFTINFDSIKDVEKKAANKEKLSSPGEVIKINLLEEKHDKDKHTILIVDDDLEIIDLFQKYFYDIYNIFYGVNGKDALEKIEKMPVKPDLIISDIMMDIMDGYEFRKELLKKDEYKYIPFIYLTAKTSKQDVVYGYQNGIIGYIKKPFELEELYLLINNLIDFIDLFKNKYLKNNDYNDNELLLKFKEMIDQFISNNSENNFNSLCFKYHISPSEKKVLSLVLKDYEDKEIADKINLAYDTVRTHIRNIRAKCNIKSKAELKRMFLAQTNKGF